MNLYIIPVTPSPNQTFTSTIPIDGSAKKIYFFLRFNTEQNCWMMNLKDENRNDLVNAIPLVSGMNLLEQHSYLNIGSAYIVKRDPNIQRDRPNEFDLGRSFVLAWRDTPE